MKKYSEETLKQMSEKYNLSIELIDILLNESTREIAKILTPQNETYVKIFLLKERPRIINIMERYDLFNESDILNCIKSDSTTINLLLHHCSRKKINIKEMIANNFNERDILNLITKEPNMINLLLDIFSNEQEYMKRILIDNFNYSWYSCINWRYDMIAYDPVIIEKYPSEAIKKAIQNLPYIYYDLPDLIINNEDYQKAVIDYSKRGLPLNIEKLCNNKNFIKMFLKESDLYEFIPQMLKCCKIIDDEIIDVLAEIVKPDIYDSLPTKVANNEKIKSKCKRTKQIYKYGEYKEYDYFGYGKDWMNKNGELIKFFSLEGGFSIKSKSDYYIIYNKYLEEKTSVANFCKKYGISSTEGFQKMLDRISEENAADKEQITDVKKNVQNEFFQSCINQAEKIAKGEITLEKFLSNPKINFNSSKINLYFDYISDDLKNKLSLIIYDYIEKNQCLISYNFVSFLTNEKVTPIDNLKKYIRPNLKMPKDKEYIQGYGQILSKMKKHEKKYNRRELYSTYIVEGKEYNINDEVIDQAYAYAKDNDYYISYFSMNYLCKQIVTGKLTYSKETKQQKEEMIDDITNLILEEKTIEDYIREMEERATKKHL